MKHGKKAILSLSLTLALLLTSAIGVLPPGGGFLSAHADTVSGFWRYSENDTGITITAYTGADENLMIPSAIDGKTVTEIGAGTFKSNEFLLSVTIPDTVTNIYSGGYYGATFGDCTNLKTVVLGDNLSSVPEGCFEGCTSLSSITIGKSVEKIGFSAFDGCSKLDNVVLPSSVKVIETRAFADCAELAAITLNDGLLEIGNGAFINCVSLPSVVIPDTVTDIYSGGYYGATFGDCTNLKTVVLGDSLSSVPEGCFEGCIGLNSVTIGKSVQKIGFSAFDGCSKLDNVVLPSSVKIIETRAFADCAELAAITLNDGLLEIGNGAFINCGSLISVVIPNTVTNIYSGGYYGATFGNCTSLKTLLIPNSVTNISDSIVSDNSSVTVKGYAGSYAQTYAAEESIPFEELPATPATEISLSPSALTVGLEQTLPLKAAVTPADTTDAVAWLSSAPDVAEVDQLGNVTGKSVGTVVIQAKTTSGKTARITVTVQTDPVPVLPPCDMNGDKEVTAADVIALRELILAGNATPEQIETGDLNEDGELTADDAALLMDALDITPGDVNGDTLVNAVDIMAIRKALLTGTPSDVQLAAGDLDGNVKLSAVDIMLLRKQLMG